MRSVGLFPGSTEPWTPEHVISSRAPAKKNTYRMAFESLENKPLERKDAVVTVMIKDEKEPLIIGKRKPPRLIQYRSSRITAYYAQWMAPFEHTFYGIHVNGFPAFAKHMNSYERAEAVVSMGGPGRTYVMLDHKQFDGHISVDHLKFEHAMYDWVYRDPQLASALKYQLSNNCYSRCGLGWKVKGGRMSGDFNTSLGNNIVNFAILYLWLKHIGVPNSEMRFLLDGDDSVLSVPDAYVDKLDLEFFKLFGFEMTIEALAKEPERVTFCQTRPVFTGTVWRMCRLFERACGRMQYTIRKHRGIGWVRYARGIAVAERQLGDGLPIFAALGRRMCELIPNLPPIIDNEQYYKCWKEPGYAALPISDECRASFALAFDITPTHQLALEQMLASASLADPLFELVRSTEPWVKPRGKTAEQVVRVGA